MPQKVNKTAIMSALTLQLLGDTCVPGVCTELASNSPPYSVMGDVSAVYFSEKGAFRTNQFKFVANRDARRCSVSTTPISRDRAFKRFEFCTDGDEGLTACVYHENLVMDQPAVKGKSANKATTTAIDLDGKVFSTPWPLPDPSLGLLSPVWLVYCAEPWIAGLQMKDQIPILEHNPIYRELGLKKTFSFKLSDTEPHCLAEYVEFDNGYDVLLLNTPPSIRERPKSQPRGFTNGFMTVLQWTNSNGLTLPLRFQITQYALSQNGASVFVAARIEGCAHGVSVAAALPICSASSILKGPIYVFDSRFSRDELPGQQVSYRRNTAETPSKAEVRSSTEYQTAKRSTGRVIRQQHARPLYLVLVFLTFVSPLFVLMARSYRRRRREEHHENPR